MIARVLAHDEWHKVAELPIAELAEFVRPQDVQIIVVEDDGQIVASMTLLRLTHLEGTWIHPEHQNAGVVRALLREAARASSDWSNAWVVTSANTEQVRNILTRMDAIPVQVDSYVLGLGQYGGN